MCLRFSNDIAPLDASSWKSSAFYYLHTVVDIIVNTSDQVSLTSSSDQRLRRHRGQWLLFCITMRRRR
jgi:hypothetical protein